MLKFFVISITLSVLLLHGLTPAIAQNTVLITSGALPGGGSGYDIVVVGPGNSYPNANNANENIFIGRNSGIAITNGRYNSFVGAYAGPRNTTGEYNSFVGNAAGYYNTSGRSNSFVGFQAGYFNTTGNQNSFMGSLAGLNTSIGSYNTFMGYEAGYGNAVGSYNSFTGYRAGFSNFTGGNNSFVGNQAGFNNDTGGNNSFMGTYAGYNNKSGGNNLFMGYESGYQNTSGFNNSSVGFRAGYINETGAFNSFVGSYSDATGANKFNLLRATALGYQALVAVNDGLVLGDTINVKVGIGTAYPNQRFTLRGNINFLAYDNSMMLKNQPFLHFNEHESLALGLGAAIPAGAERTLVLGSGETSVQIPGILSTYQPNAGQFLTVNHLGKVILAHPRVQVASVADWSDKVFEPGYALRPLGEVEEFVKKNKHLPGVPSAAAMVAEGMESVAFNARLLEKIEELTLYVVALEKQSEEVKTLRNEVAELKLLIQQVKPQTPPR